MDKSCFYREFPQYYHIRVTNRLINFLKLLRIGNVPNMVNQGAKNMFSLDSNSYIQPNLSLQSILQDIKSATLSKLRLLFGFYWLSFREQPNIQISWSRKKCKLICKYLNPKLTLHQVGAVIKCQRTKVGFFCISLATILLYLRQQCISGVPCVSQQWYTPNSKRRNATLVQIKQALNPRRLANLNLQLDMIVAP